MRITVRPRQSCNRLPRGARALKCVHERSPRSLFACSALLFVQITIRLRSIAYVATVIWLLRQCSQALDCINALLLPLLLLPTYTIALDHWIIASLHHCIRAPGIAAGQAWLPRRTQSHSRRGNSYRRGLATFSAELDATTPTTSLSLPPSTLLKLLLSHCDLLSYHHTPHWGVSSSLRGKNSSCGDLVWPRLATFPTKLVTNTLTGLYHPLSLPNRALFRCELSFFRK